MKNKLFENKLFNEIHSFGKRYAAITSGYSLTYAELDQICKNISPLLGKRSLIFHVCTHSLGSLAGYVAFMNNDHVQLLLNEEIDRDGLEQLIKRYHPQYIFLPREWDSHFLETERIAPVFEYLLLKFIVKSDANPPRQEKITPLHRDLALLLTTSGSTGSAKYVRLSYRNLHHNAEAIAQCLEIKADDRPITILPMNYTYGLSIINSHLLVGATLLLTSKKIIQREFWDFFIEKGATTISGTPYTYQMLYKLGLLTMQLPSLKSMTQSGGKLPETLQKIMAEFAHNTGRRLHIMYGQTEATARIACLPHQVATIKSGSIGVSIPGGRMALCDEEGKEITTAETVGEIVCFGPSISMGYASDRFDLAKGDEREGVLYTGDMGKRDADGFYYIVGRKSRIIKMFGNRFSMDEIEAIIKDEYPTVECACCGSDDQMEIFVNAHTKELREDIKATLVNRTKINARGIMVYYIEELPVDGAGKIMYKQLEKH
ncbi:MAG: AMP-binding protein [Lachnospiraceae bacterium]|nr:AMP-binding protein [Lachnospiraceae bacterium]